MLESITNVIPNQRVKIIMTGYGESYIHEQDDLYEYSAKFVFELYSARYECYKCMTEPVQKNNVWDKAAKWLLKLLKM